MSKVDALPDLDVPSGLAAGRLEMNLVPIGLNQEMRDTWCPWSSIDRAIMRVASE